MAGLSAQARDAQFALRALMEIPEQYAEILQQRLLDPSAGQRIYEHNIPDPKEPPSADAPQTSAAASAPAPAGQ